MRALAVVAASLLLCGQVAWADTIDTNIRHMADSTYKVRLAAALALSESRDPRAVIALAGALTRDDHPTVRGVAARALGKMIDDQTADAARELGLDAIARAARRDPDAQVRDTALRVQQNLAGLRRKKPRLDNRTDKPEVFVNIDDTTDQSKIAPRDAGERLDRIVRRNIEQSGYATRWPGGLPTQTELTTNHARAFIIASTVRKIEISRLSHGTQVSCRLDIRVAPWSGTDGGEKWEANKAASASGSAKAMTGNSEREITSGIHDCLDAVAEDVTARQVLPFLKRLAASGS